MANKEIQAVCCLYFVLNKRLSSYDNIKRKNDINGGEWVRGGMDF